MKYWVLAQTPVDTPADKPRDVRGWVHYHDEGGAWGCRLRVELETSDPREALGWLEFFAAEAPLLTANQHIELFAGRQLMLVCDVLTVHDGDGDPSHMP